MVSEENLPNGCAGLVQRRERRKGEDFTFADGDFLGANGGQAEGDFCHRFPAKEPIGEGVRGRLMCRHRKAST